MYKQPTMIHGVTGFKKMSDIEEVNTDTTKPGKTLKLPKPVKWEKLEVPVGNTTPRPGTITLMPNPYKDIVFQQEFNRVFNEDMTPMQKAGFHRGNFEDVHPVLEMTKRPQSGSYWHCANLPKPSTIAVDIKKPVVSQLESADLGRWTGGERWHGGEVTFESDIRLMNKKTNQAMTIPAYMLADKVLVKGQAVDTKNGIYTVTGISKPTEDSISKVDMDAGTDCSAPVNSSPITPKPQVTGNGGLGWPFPTGGSGPLGQTIVGSSGVGSLSGSVSYANPIPALTTVQLTSMSITGGNTIPKDDVQYIVVLKDGQCIELVEQQTMTPREMLNIAKFISMVSQVSIVGQHTNIKVQWSDLIDNLGINNHFEDGFPNPKQYKLDMGIQYVFLYDTH